MEWDRTPNISFPNIFSIIKAFPRTQLLVKATIKFVFTRFWHLKYCKKRYFLISTFRDIRMIFCQIEFLLLIYIKLKINQSCFESLTWIASSFYCFSISSNLIVKSYYYPNRMKDEIVFNAGSEIRQVTVKFRKLETL